MKIKISILIIICFLFGLLTTNVYASITGDVDGNDKLEASDYILVKKYILKQITLTSSQLERADVDNNGVINTMDYANIRKITINIGNNPVTSTPTPTPSPSITPTPTPVNPTATPVPTIILKTDVYPIPVNASISNSYANSIDASKITFDSSASSYKTIFTHFGFKEGNSGTVAKVIINTNLKDEEYNLIVNNTGIQITTKDKSGVYNAVSTLGQLLQNGRLPQMNINDYPSTAYRGVIEGFYGTPWSHNFRLKLLKYMGKYKMNMYIYAPKNEPKHLSSWRTAYTSEELKKFKELVNTARENNVEFVYAISPGGDISLGSESDFQKLLDKCESLYKVGVRRFAIFLDDIQTKNYSGHAQLLNKFQTRFVAKHEGVGNLIAISPEYCNSFMSNYTEKLAPLLNKKIIMMWTGKSVINAIKQSDLTKINKLYKNKVLIWWNYPVNDATKTNYLHMGPCENMDKGLSNTISGLTANPMIQGNASIIPILTTADYLWNPNSYDADRSLKTAINIFDSKNATGLTYFVDFLRYSSINKKPKYSYVKEGVDIDKYLKGKRNKENIENLVAKFKEISKSLKELRSTGNKAFINEVSDWLNKMITYSDMALTTFRIENEILNNGSATKIRGYINTYKSLKSSVSGNSKIVSDDLLTKLVSYCNNRIDKLSAKY